MNLPMLLPWGLALLLGLPASATPPAGHGAAQAPTVPAAAQARRFGPFATMRRRNEVPNQCRRAGWRAVAFHNGDGWYVDVRR